jgi:CRISPR-associated protein Cst2
MIQSLSLCAEIVLDLHNLNSEGREGNEQQTRMVHIVDGQGDHHCVNAVSGDMFKHIFVKHLSPILASAGQPLSPGAALGSPDRITTDLDFKSAIKGKNAAEIQSEMLERCAVTDIAGTLFTEGVTVPRKSCVEFGWVVGIPARVHTEQHFHVKYDADRRKSARGVPRGEGTVAGSQTVFHRPLNSGAYALICHLELSRVGVNDVTRERVISPADQAARQRGMLQALVASLIRPAGAQSSTQSPHVVDCRGVISTSTSYLPAPTISPLAANYREQSESIAATLNKLSPSSVACRAFDCLSSGLALLEEITADLSCTH